MILHPLTLPLPLKGERSVGLVNGDKLEKGILLFGEAS